MPTEPRPRRASAPAREMMHVASLKREPRPKPATPVVAPSAGRRPKPRDKPATAPKPADGRRSQAPAAKPAKTATADPLGALAERQAAKAKAARRPIRRAPAKPPAKHSKDSGPTQ